MYSVNLRKVGGSVMLTVPPAILEILSLKVGSAVAMTIEQHRLVVQAERKPRYELDDLLSMCDPNAEVSAQDNAWLNGIPIGSEVI